MQLTIGHDVTYPMVGDDFDSLTSDCSQPQLSSDYDPDPAQFNDSEWIGAPYTLDGETIYAVIHNEYRVRREHRPVRVRRHQLRCQWPRADVRLLLLHVREPRRLVPA